jgi:hypothetical protein
MEFDGRQSWGLGELADLEEKCRSKMSHLGCGKVTELKMLRKSIWNLKELR